MKDMYDVGSDESWQWMETAERYYIRDPKDKEFRLSMAEEIWSWCENHCKGKFWIGMGYGCFELDTDATMFLLRWS